MSGTRYKTFDGRPGARQSMLETTMALDKSGLLKEAEKIYDSSDSPLADLMSARSQISGEDVNVATFLQKYQNNEIVEPKPAIDSVLVKAQNVYDYCSRHANAHGWGDITKFVNSRPPFKRVVVSYENRNFDHADVIVIELLPENVIKYLKENKLDKVKNNESLTLIETLNPFRMLAFTVALNGVELGCFTFILIDEQGRVLATEDNTAFILIMQSESISAELEPELIHKFQTDTLIVGLATINFMNCKNVEVIDNHPSRQQRRACEREGKRPPVTYKTLQIHPMGKKISPKSDNHTGIEMPLHICRGHFKSYKEGKGLGRWHVHGTYWWSPQVRGNAERGRVEKDYEVTSA